MKTNMSKWNFFIFCILVLMVLIVTPITFQNDTFSAIKVGERIVNEGFPEYDNFSIHEGLTFTYPHWLFDVIVYSVFSVSGFLGLYIFLCILYFILMYTLYFVSYKISGNKILALLLCIPSFILIRSGLAVRAQIVSYILFILEIYSIEMFLKTNCKRYLFYLVVISFAIINFHVAVWPLYFIFYLPYFINFIKFDFSRFKSKEYSNLKVLLIPFVISLLLGWIGPLGLDAYNYSLNVITSSNAISHISEHQPAMIKTPSGLKIFVYLLFVYGVFFVTKSKITLMELSMMSGIALMCFTSVRHFHLLVIVAPLFMTRYIANLFDEYNIDFNYDDILNILFKPKAFFAFFLILGAALSNYIPQRFSSQFINSSLYPVEATKFIKQNLDYRNLKIFNHYNFGSYLLLNDIPVFIDSRCDLYLDSFSNDCNVCGDFFATTNVQKYYIDIFKKYDIDYVLLYKDSVVDLLISKNSDFKLIYDDEKFVLYNFLKEM